MKRMFAYYCPDCDEIFEYKQRLLRELSCPSCTNKLVLPLHRIMFYRQEVKHGNNPKRIRTVMLDNDGVGSYGSTIKTHTADEVLKAHPSDSSKDAVSGIPKIPSNLGGVRCPENEPGTRLSGGIDLHGK